MNNWKYIKEEVYRQHRFYRKVVEAFDITKCYECFKENCKTEIHHKKPKKFGGSDDIENLIPLCRDCHKKTFIKNVWTLRKWT